MPPETAGYDDVYICKSLEYPTHLTLNLVINEAHNKGHLQ